MEQGAERGKELRVMPKKHQRRQQLHAQDDAYDLQEELPHIEIPAQQGLAHGLPAGEGHLLAPQKEDQAGIGHDAQTAHLDEHEQHPLPHRAQRPADVHRGQAGHTYRGRGKESGIHHGEARALPLADGQAQGQRPQQDHGRKGNGRPCQGGEITFALHAPPLGIRTHHPAARRHAAPGRQEREGSPPGQPGGQRFRRCARRNGLLRQVPGAACTLVQLPGYCKPTSPAAALYSRGKASYSARS